MRPNAHRLPNLNYLHAMLKIFALIGLVLPLLPDADAVQSLAGVILNLVMFTVGLGVEHVDRKKQRNELDSIAGRAAHLNIQGLPLPRGRLNTYGIETNLIGMLGIGSSFILNAASDGLMLKAVLDKDSAEHFNFTVASVILAIVAFCVHELDENLKRNNLSAAINLKNGHINQVLEERLQHLLPANQPIAAIPLDGDIGAEFVIVDDNVQIDADAADENADANPEADAGPAP